MLAVTHYSYRKWISLGPPYKLFVHLINSNSTNSPLLIFHKVSLNNLNFSTLLALSEYLSSLSGIFFFNNLPL